MVKRNLNLKLSQTKGYLLRTPNAQVRMCICFCILNLITFTNIPDSYENLQRCSKAFVLRTIRNSDLAETLVKVKYHKIHLNENYSSLNFIVSHFSL